MARAAAPAPAARTDGEGDFDWEHAESELGDVVPPMFVEGEPAEPGGGGEWEVERVDVRLDDVGGLADVKERLEVAFLAPLRNPELRRLYGKTLRGGLLLYGPPGCGKSFVARASPASSAPASCRCRSTMCSTCGSARASATCTTSSSRRATRRACSSSTSSTRSASGARSSTTRRCGRWSTSSSPSSTAWRAQRGRLRPRRDEPPVGRRHRAAPARPLRPDGARAAARRAGAGGDLQDAPEGPAGRRDRPREAGAAERRPLRRRPRARVRDRCGARARRRRPHRRAPPDRDARPRGCSRPGSASVGPWFETARNVVLFANEDGVYDDLLAYLKRRKLV